jgi:hypothetical protein
MAMAVALLGMLSGCSQSEVDIVLGGTVRYDEYQSGPIRLVVGEEETQDCGLTSCTDQTPGRTVARLELERPGEFSIHATVQDSDSASAVELLGYALGTSTDVGHCEAGAYVSMSAANHRDIVLVLERGICPMRD